MLHQMTEGWIFTFHYYGYHEHPVVRYYKSRDHAIKAARDYLYNYQEALLSTGPEVLRDFDRITENSGYSSSSGCFQWRRRF
jgi:hypothetical protein